MTALAAPAVISRHLPVASGGVDRAIRVSTAAVVLAVAGIAAYISYWHAYAVVREYGKNVDFDVFLIQVPNAPFGLSWYQGDIQTNSTGSGSVNFLGRFSIETFIVAPGTAPAPVVFHNTFPDASSNPKNRRFA